MTEELRSGGIVSEYLPVGQLSSLQVRATEVSSLTLTAGSKLIGRGVRVR
jgi:hypothetical protein